MQITWTRVALAAIVISIIFTIAAIVIHNINELECSQLVVPSYRDILRQMHDFQYKTRSCRFTAQAIIKYKLDALNNPDHVGHLWKLNKMTDYALHSIVVSDILDDPQQLVILNDPSFVEIVNDYDLSRMSFYNPISRERAIQLLLKYPDTEDKKNAANIALERMSNEQIYLLLIHGYKT